MWTGTACQVTSSTVWMWMACRTHHTFVSIIHIRFLSIDLPIGEEALSALPDRVFIGLANKGTDENYLAIALSRRKKQCVG